MLDFDDWFDIWEQQNSNRVRREDARTIWEAAQNVIKGQMIKAFIPKFGEEAKK
jgi:hypothetical protein